MPNLICSAPSCKKRLTGKQRKFCSTQCNKRTWAQTKRHNKKIEAKPINKDFKADEGDYASVRRGQYYTSFVKEGLAEAVANGDMTVVEAASLLGCTSATVSRMLAAFKIDSKNEVLAEDWELSKEAKRNLKNFSSFRNKYFATETGEKYETADFHENWINSILTAIDEGNELLILSTTIHGKT